MCNDFESLFDEVFAGSKWSEQKNFPPCSEWKAEVEKHLQFMQKKGWLAAIKPQLQSREYESFLSEIFAAYFVEINLGFEVTQWNPQTTKQGHNVECCIKDGAGGEIFCEVKSPGWKGELTEEEKRSGRAKQSKHLLPHESRSTASYKNIRETIRKSYRKFLSGKQNLLIITDDFFVPAAMDPLSNSCTRPKMPWNIWIALYNNDPTLYAGVGCFATEDYENLGGVLFLNNRFLGKLFAWFEVNPNAIIPVDSGFVLEARKLNKERSESAKNEYIKHDGTD